MAAPLKDGFGLAVARRIGRMIRSVHPAFPLARYERDVARGYDALELMPRARHIVRALHEHLPPDYPRALAVLLDSLGPLRGSTTGEGMASFLYLPHVLFVGEHGLDHFELSMRAQYELTQRFTAEFSIRPFLERHPEATLARLAEWARDGNVHVRRLVSEGTRPRLPWAPRLRGFQRDPRPVLALLELLKDDPELYVRRSVANNLNDIGKDHPGRLIATARRWLRGASPERRWIVERALRSRVKACDPEALALLGYAGGTALALVEPRIAPRRVKAGASVAIGFQVLNGGARPERMLADFRVHFVKAGGRTAPKVFKLKTATLAPGQALRVGKSVSLAPMTTRRHHPGRHAVEALVNGKAYALGYFDVVA